MFLSSSPGGDRVVVVSVPQHGEQDVAATAGESDQGLVVPLSLADLALVVGAGDGVTQCRAGRRTVAPEIPSSLNTVLQPAFFRAASCRAGFWSSVEPRA